MTIEHARLGVQEDAREGARTPCGHVTMNRSESNGFDDEETTARTAAAVGIGLAAYGYHVGLLGTGHLTAVAFALGLGVLAFAGYREVRASND